MRGHAYRDKVVPLPLAVETACGGKGGENLAISYQEKEAIVRALNEKFSEASVAVLTKFTGLDVSDTADLRRTLRNSEVEFKVSKNTFFRRAVEGTPAAVLLEHFWGPNAVAFGYDDPVLVAKLLVDFAKNHPALEIRGGVLNGKYIDASGIEALSKLPSREVLLAQLLSVLVASPRGLVQALSGIPRKLLYALQAIKDQKE